MKKISQLTQKQILLQILIYVDSICKQNSIEYSLCGGSLLGAIRHHGFIPWDDDVDILLSRPNYEKLIDVLKKKKDKYKLLLDTDKGSYYAYTKLFDSRTILKTKYKFDQKVGLGIFIDIFPIDGLPDSLEERKDFQQELMNKKEQLLCAPTYYYSATTRWRSIVKFFFLMKKHWLNRDKKPSDLKYELMRLMKKYKYDESTWAGFCVPAYGVREMLPKSVAYMMN